MLSAFGTPQLLVMPKLLYRRVRAATPGRRCLAAKLYVDREDEDDGEQLAHKQL